MAAETISRCPAPFLSKSDFPYTGGCEHVPLRAIANRTDLYKVESSRLCRPILESTTCCLPCPLADWVYPDSIMPSEILQGITDVNPDYLYVTNAANWVSLGSVACCCFLLLSFAVLPVQRTSRHYLTICLVSAIGLCCLSFLVALGASPVQCADAITPNDMHSDISCAFGSLVVFGGFASVTWVFLRSLYLYLQICWQIVPGRKYFYASLIAGWGTPSVILTASLCFSGVSYRFGNICHINHNHAKSIFWGPMLAFAGFASILQLITFGYCIRVYLSSVIDSSSAMEVSSHLQSLHGSTKTVTTRAAYRRVREVIAMQWRGMMVVLILIVSVVYFSVVFIRLDGMTAAEIENPKAAAPWLECIILYEGDKSRCLDLVVGLTLSEPAMMAVLFLIASFGYWCAFFLGRLSMISGWIELVRDLFKKRQNLIPTHTFQFNDPSNYEMLSSPPQGFYLAKGPSAFVATTTTAGTTHISRVGDLSLSSRHVKPPQMERGYSVNFSYPRPLERAATRFERGKLNDEYYVVIPVNE